MSVAPKCLATKQDHSAQAEGASWTLDVIEEVDMLNLRIRGAAQVDGLPETRLWPACSHGSCGSPLEY